MMSDAGRDGFASYPSLRGRVVLVTGGATGTRSPPPRSGSPASLAGLGHDVEISEHVADRVADLRGHDERSCDSPAHRDLLSHAARWLTRELCRLAPTPGTRPLRCLRSVIRESLVMRPPPELSRRKWPMRSFWYPRGYRILHLSHFLRVNGGILQLTRWRAGLMRPVMSSGPEMTVTWSAPPSPRAPLAREHG